MVNVTRFYCKHIFRLNVCTQRIPHAPYQLLTHRSPSFHPIKQFPLHQDFRVSKNDEKKKKTLQSTSSACLEACLFVPLSGPSHKSCVRRKHTNAYRPTTQGRRQTHWTAAAVDEDIASSAPTTRVIKCVTSILAPHCPDAWRSNPPTLITPSSIGTAYFKKVASPAAFQQSSAPCTSQELYKLFSASILLHEHHPGRRRCRRGCRHHRAPSTASRCVLNSWTTGKRTKGHAYNPGRRRRRWRNGRSFVPFLSDEELQLLVITLWVQILFHTVTHHHYCCCLQRYILTAWRWLDAWLEGKLQFYCVSCWVWIEVDFNRVNIAEEGRF